MKKFRLNHNQLSSCKKATLMPMSTSFILQTILLQVKSNLQLNYLKNISLTDEWSRSISRLSNLCLIWVIILNLLKILWDKTTLRSVWTNILISPLNLNSCKILKRLPISIRNVLMLVLELNMLKVKHRLIWASESVKNKFWTNSKLWEIWKLPWRRLRMATSEDWKNKLVRSWSESTRR